MELEPVDGRAPITALDESSLDLNTSSAQILHLIEGSPKVVEFGCGAGSLARFLTQRGCTVIGVDLDAEAASVAREFCADVLIADLDETTPLKLFPTERFDVAILGGILERLRKPERLLAETSRVLRPGGYVIASLHNVGHGAIRLAMLKGQLREMKASFTLKGVEALFGDAGFFIETVARTTAPVFEADSPLVPRLERTNFNESIVAEVEGDPEAESVQFIVKALPASSAAARNIENQRRVESLEQRIAQLEEQLADSQAQLSAKLDAPTTQHLEEVQRQLHVAIFGPEGVEALQAQLQQRNDELTALREQMTTLAAREESTARREAKLAKENLDALDVSAELRKTLEEREATIATLRGELDVAATTIRQRSGELSKIADREKQIERERASAFAALDEVRRDVTAMRQELNAEHQRLRRLDQKFKVQQVALSTARETIRVQGGALATFEVELEAAKDDATHALGKLRNAQTLQETTEASRAELASEIDALRDRHQELKRAQGVTRQEIEAMRQELEAQGRARDRIESAWRDAKQQYAQTLSELHRAQAVVSELNARCERDEFYLREMRESKFWRLRNAWFSVKRAFGVTTDIP